MQNIERKKVMEHIGMKLTEEHVRWAALGGSILGGGGGGSAKTGAEFGDLAVRFSQLELTPLDQIRSGNRGCHSLYGRSSCRTGEVCLPGRYDALRGALYSKHGYSSRRYRY